LCDWNQNRYYKSLLTLLSIYTHYIIGMLPLMAIGIGVNSSEFLATASAGSGILVVDS
jgi:hypothetical protein